MQDNCQYSLLNVEPYSTIINSNILRGETMPEKTKKATFNLHVDILKGIDEAMKKGMAPSKNALVEQALIKELKEMRRSTRKARWEAAAKDPLFLKDIAQIGREFKSADSETARRIR